MRGKHSPRGEEENEMCPIRNDFRKPLFIVEKRFVRAVRFHYIQKAHSSGENTVRHYPSHHSHESRHAFDLKLNLPISLGAGKKIAQSRLSFMISFSSEPRTGAGSW
jgi:hypothetical protein